MIKLGEKQELEVIKKVDFGVYLAAIGPKGILNGEDMYQFLLLSFRKIQQPVLHARFG